MAFDFQSAVAAANQAVEQAENAGQGGSSANYAYPLVYPQKGHTITLRPLFNPASGQIVRLVNRHEKVACYRTYNIECPICKVQQQVKDMTGQDPFGRDKRSKSRGICFAQYISSTNQIDKGGNRGVLQPGEIILFMFPWSVYSQINAIIQGVAQTPTGMDQAFSHATTGMFLQISVSSDFKYTTVPVPYMTFGQQSDDDFMKMLEGMESLTEQVLPSSITEDVDKQVKEYADAIYRQYVAPRTPAGVVPPAQAPAPMTQQAPMYQQPAQPTVQPTYPPATTTPAQVPYAPPATISAPAVPVPQAQTPASSTSTRPACYGDHQANDPKCICCPYEVECMQPGDTTPF